MTSKLVRLKNDVYPPEHWSKREVLFHKGQVVPVSPADNLPAYSIIKYWIDLPDPRTGAHNPYGFGLNADEASDTVNN